ncbi:MAG: sigma D regulator [Oceanospirillales bacterium]|uniref:Regulator of sigma D n=1 Tax=Marinobacterium halophilum TaxID=267374 RepID=A0A2P8EY61_9GAMM|nr:sigma D regulator [Marinobacterium halophilum]MBR9828441.1 sigma D regulator [Oceanospirillales bacterium]PSL14412.1 regulator of sigma D [Marinobacterium halophilum]
MLEKCRNAKDRWGGVSTIIDHWLEERQRLISVFVSIPTQEVGSPLNSSVGEFCDLLMDYLSSGHFEVYEQLLREGSEFADGSLEQAQEIFPHIQPSTDSALDFNDTYGTLGNMTLQQVCQLARELSELGETLEERFALEDQLIEILHNAHKELVEST